MATLQDIANAMFGVEGSNPNDLNHRNNNPGNLIYVGQKGATLGAGGFAKFATWDDGVNEAIGQMQLDLTRGTAGNGRPTTTLAELIGNGWSPANAPGNSQLATSNYIATVANATGVDPNADLASQVGFHRGLIHKA